MPTSDEVSFIDANILVYAAMEDAPQSNACRSLLSSDRPLCLSPQVFADFYSVVTSPKRVSAPFTAAEAVDFIIQLLPRVEVLPLQSGAVLRWMKLALEGGVTGADVFDLQIIATMLEQGVTQIYTYNRGDFAGFAELTVLTP